MYTKFIYILYTMYIVRIVPPFLCKRGLLCTCPSCLLKIWDNLRIRPNTPDIHISICSQQVLFQKIFHKNNLSLSEKGRWAIKCSVKWKATRFFGEKAKRKWYEKTSYYKVTIAKLKLKSYLYFKKFDVIWFSSACFLRG